MARESRFQRNFLIFRKEDPGYGVGQGTSGYVKIEVRDGKGKLSAAVQNLKDGQDMYVYKLYLIEPKGRDSKIAYAGVVPVVRNKGELNWAFNPDNVAMTGSSIDRFTVAALLVEYKDRKPYQVICPMAAYKDKMVSWREGFRLVLYAKAGEYEPIDGEALRNEIKRSEAKAVKFKESEAEERKVRESEGKDGEIKESEVKQGEVKEGEVKGTEAKESEIKAGGVNGTGSKAGEATKAGEAEKSEVSGNESIHMPEEQGSSAKAGQDGGSVDRQDRSSEYETGTGMGNMQGYFDWQTAGGGSGQMGWNGMGCIFQNSGFYGPYFNSGSIPCERCYLNKGNDMGNIIDKAGTEHKPGTEHKEDTEHKAGTEHKESTERKTDSGLKKLENSFNRYFEKFDPFRNKRSDYMWWKIASPVHLNNVLYQHNISTPLLFNPAVMMSHFKYRHLIAGIYRDEVRKLSFIVCGIPAVYDLDTRPFGNMCRWAQVDAGRPRYGAFGYWLVYIDPKTGKFLKME